VGAHAVTETPISQNKTLNVDYFDALYRQHPDPWNFETSAYEANKYAASLAALGGRRYARGLEIGCSIGVLTRSLATAVDRLFAIDISAIPLETAAGRNRDLTNITFEVGALPHALPVGPFDLIVLSEVLYYLSPADLDTAAAAVLRALSPGGDVLMVHWLGETGYPLTGDEAANRFIARVGLRLTIVRQERTAQYRLDLLRAAVRA